MFNRRKTKCNHNWEIKGWDVTKHYRGYQPGKLPHHHTTHATLVCSVCGSLEFIEKIGAFPDPRSN